MVDIYVPSQIYKQQQQQLVATSNTDAQQQPPQQRAQQQAAAAPVVFFVHGGIWVTGGDRAQNALGCVSSCNPEYDAVQEATC